MISDQAYGYLMNADEMWQVENAETAIVSEQIYDCHHKIGAYCNRSSDRLIEMGLYYDRTPNELQLMSRADHSRIHILCRKNPIARENLRRLEMQRCYEKGYPIEPWMLTDEECKELEKEIAEFREHISDHCHQDEGLIPPQNECGGSRMTLGGGSIPPLSGIY